MSRVFWDTNLFIYLFEGKGHLAERVVALRHRMIERQDQLLTSSLTLGEILVKPKEVGDEAQVMRYRQAIEQAAWVLPLDSESALRFAEIRAMDRTIRPPDAIQLACAAQAQTDLFITNDDRLSRKSIGGIQFIQSLEKVFL